jgi:hypothetical protein
MRPYRAHRFACAFLAALLALPAVAASPAACKATSGPRTTPLVELFTSEGCDSCPPADRWLSAQFPRVAGPGAPVAVAFHVDYWDRLGWVDRFGSPKWTERQYEAVHARRDGFAYTPQVLLQGRDFRGWGRDATRALDEAAQKPARADLELTATVDGNAVRANVTARVADAAARKSARIVIAYADSALTSDVKAGENKGVRLTHDHVVRALAKGREGATEASAAFTRPTEAGASPTLVAFIQDTASNDVLQAVALALAACSP